MLDSKFKIGKWSIDMNNESKQMNRCKINTYKFNPIIYGGYLNHVKDK
jgi:hypothetical protein